MSSPGSRRSSSESVETGLDWSIPLACLCTVQKRSLGVVANFGRCAVLHVPCVYANNTHVSHKYERLDLREHEPSGLRVGSPAITRNVIRTQPIAARTTEVSGLKLCISLISPCFLAKWECLLLYDTAVTFSYRTC